MLAGSTRIRLLRRMHEHPGENIASLASALGICRPHASQEMRRIQSRGFLKPTHRGASLVYLPAADPQVPAAAPLWKAIQKALISLPQERDVEMKIIASGLAHERRIALASMLLHAPKTSGELLAELPMAPCSHYLHLESLMAGGFAIKKQQRFEFCTPAHPLGRALTRLLRQGICK